jgi:signal peptidase I
MKINLREVVVAILIFVVVFAVVQISIGSYKVQMQSMDPTFFGGPKPKPQDCVMVDKLTYRFRGPHRSEVAILWPPKSASDGKNPYIKRVIGLPGDTVRIKDKQVFVNDQTLSEPYVVHSDSRILPAAVSSRDNMGPIVVPPNSLFVMGDNRDESYDSRFWKFVDVSELRGKAFVIYWSWNRDGELSLSPGQGYVRWNRIGDLLH